MAGVHVGRRKLRLMQIRAGTRIIEDPGTNWERYPGDYAVRVIETAVAL